MRAGEARRTLALRLFIWSLIVTGYAYRTDVIPSFSSEVQQKLAHSEKELRPSIYSFTFAFLRYGLSTAPNPAYIAFTKAYIPTYITVLLERIMSFGSSASRCKSGWVVWDGSDHLDCFNC